MHIIFFAIFIQKSLENDFTSFRPSLINYSKEKRILVSYSETKTDETLTQRYQVKYKTIKIQSCTFSDIRDNQNKGGGMYIETASGKPAKSFSQTDIINCTFIKCAGKSGGAISINAQQNNRYYKISRCVFIENQAVDNKGGALYLNATYITVEKCHFQNNIAISGSDIYYRCPTTNSLGKSQYFTTMESTFIQTIDTTEKFSIFFLEWKEKSKIDFNSSKTYCSNNAYLFDYSGTVNNKNVIVRSNSISPDKDHLLIPNKGEIFTTSSFEVISNEPPLITDEPTLIITEEPEPVITEKPTKQITESPAAIITPTQKPEDPAEIYCSPIQNKDLIKLNKNKNSYSTNNGDSQNKIIYACDLDLKRIYGYSCVAYLYHCTFNSIIDTSNGGAIYLNVLAKSSTPSDISIEVYHCNFDNCQAKNGGAIYFITKQYKRFFNTSNCVFTQNTALEKNGGAIYFLATYGEINKCKFINNVAQNGGDIYYHYNSQTTPSSECNLAV